jgi:hypothetical protein
MKTETKLTLKQRIKDRLAELREAGATANELAAWLEASYGSTSEACYMLCQKGEMASRKVGAPGKSNQLKRYFLTQYAPPLANITAAGSRPKTAARPKVFDHAQPQTLAAGFAFTRCPGFERVADQRPTVTPFFSARRPGDYPLHTGSAIERALESAA